jgi:hypothetical protein
LTVFLITVGVASALALAVRSCPRPLPPGWDGDDPRQTNFRLARTDDETPAAFVDDAQVLAAGDFHFLMGEGSGRDGYDVVNLWADGRCEYTFGQWQPVNDPVHGWVTGKVWRRAEFRMPADTVTALRRLLVDVDYFTLKRGYHANVCDGTQWIVKARAAGRAKRVYCNNHFPVKVIALSEFVRTRILDPHRAEITRAEPVVLGPMDQWNDFESP